MDGAGAAAAQRVGTTLKGKYRLEQLIGVGGMAAVYRGTHRNGNRVAVKVLHTSISGHAELRERFLREGYVANRVEHRGAVRVLDDDTSEDGSVFLVMELLEGDSLDARWERAGRQLPHREVAELTHQLLDVLATAHEKGIIHRDIKPENLFITHEGMLKVLDFGIARLRETGAAAMMSMTRTGNMLGTPAYMPPEQVLGRSREVDGQTDVWAVGATMFTLISGRYVHEAETIQEMLVYAGSRHARSLGSVAPNTPPALAAVIDRALIFDKAMRWPTARAMRSALGNAYFSSFGETLSGTRPALTPIARTVPDSPWLPPSNPPPTPPTTLPMGGPRATALAAARRAQRIRTTTGGIERRGSRASDLGHFRGARVAIGAVAATLVVGAVGAVLTLRHGSDAPIPSPNPGAAPLSQSGAERPDVSKLIESAERLKSAEPIPMATAETRVGVDAAVLRVNRSPRGGSMPSRTVDASTDDGTDDPQAIDRVLSGLRASRVSTSTSASPAPGKPNCQPPYTIDVAGRRIPKPECL